MRRLYLFFIMLSAIPSCTSYVLQVEPPIPAYKAIQNYQLFVLTQPLTVLPDKAAVYFQNGKVIDPNLINQRTPNCRLVVNGLSEQERQINPDTFKLLRVNYDSYLVMTDTNAARFAALTISSHSLSGGDNPIAEEYSTYFHLKSEKQPIVSQLICKHWEDPHDGYHLSLNQVRQALGNIIEIRMSP